MTHVSCTQLHILHSVSLKLYVKGEEVHACMHQWYVQYMRFGRQCYKTVFFFRNKGWGSTMVPVPPFRETLLHVHLYMYIF